MHALKTRSHVITLVWLVAATVALQAGVRSNPRGDVDEALAVLSSNRSVDAKLDAIGKLGPDGRVELIGTLGAKERSALWTRHYERWLDSGVLTPGPREVVLRAAEEVSHPEFFEQHKSGPICDALNGALSGQLAYLVTVALGSTPQLPNSGGLLAESVASGQRLLAGFAEALIPTLHASRPLLCKCPYDHFPTCCPETCFCQFTDECTNFAQPNCGCNSDEFCTGVCGNCGG